MPKYAVTTVFYLECNDEDHLRNIMDHVVDESALYWNKGEDWQIVEISEVESF